MQKQNYRSRVIDQKIEDYLDVLGAIVIEGPKWCGKTWTSSQHSKSEFLLGEPAGNFQNRQLAEISPDIVLAGETPRMLDEWQEVPMLWDAVRAEVDRRNAKGQFILTGSSTPNRKGILHSGAGRIGRIRMRPMSLYEAGFSSGKVSLSALCNGNFSPCMNGECSLLDLAGFLVRGGWPGNLETPDKKAGIIASEYIDALLENDVNRVDVKKRNIHKMHLLLRSLARNESTTASFNVLKNDISTMDGENVDNDTISEYLNVLQRLFVIDNQLPFAPGVRSPVRIKQSEKRHLADPSLACALLNLTQEGLVNDLKTFGFLFEALCVRDLRIYANSFGGELYHYQDYRNNELAAVVELQNGRWIAVEVKLGANQIDAAAENLLHINEFLGRSGNAAEKLIVVCGVCNAAYQRKDGVYVVPITMLKP